MTLPDFARAREVHRVIQAVEAAEVHDRELADAAPYLGDEVRERLQAGRVVTAAQLAAARAAASAYREAVLAVLDEVDVIVAPVTAFGAPLRDATEAGGLPLREALMRHVGPVQPARRARARGSGGAARRPAAGRAGPRPTRRRSRADRARAAL